MPDKVGYLKVSAIQDNIIKKIAENSNKETKNDTIDTQSEWKSLMSGIASAFGSGEITYDVAKKYVDLSSSIFAKSNRLDKAYKQGFVEGMDIIHKSWNSRLKRKFSNLVNEGELAKVILRQASLAVMDEY